MRCCILGFALGFVAGWALCAARAEAANLPLLRDVICKYETRHVAAAERDYAVGRHDEVGRCQVLPSTADWLGVRFPALAQPEINRAVALMWLEHCWSAGARTVRLLGTCYNGGRRSRSEEAYWYGKTVASHYAERVRCREWAPCAYRKEGP